MNIFRKWYRDDLNKVYSRFKGFILDNVIGDTPDLQTYFENLRKHNKPDTKILISYYNPAWEPILNLVSKLGLRKKKGKQNWIGTDDLRNLLHLTGFEEISTQRRLVGITMITVVRQKPYFTDNPHNQYSVSIIIPAKNEEGNIDKIIPSIPKFGKSQEIIFVAGNSKDQTWEKILEATDQKKRSFLEVRGIKQKGEGKASAVWQGLKIATGDILIVYDADRTVDAKDLKKFYQILASNLGEFANGNRLMYPMENDAMRTFNKIGNQIFSRLFTWILGQYFKDTLCGTKAFFRKDFCKFSQSKTDPFGDFDLIFGVVRNNLKIVEVPVRYKERVYGSTNINRLNHGLLLLKMTWIAYKEFKA